MRKKTKRRYKKPQVTKINLKTEEAVLGFCKAQTMSTSGVDQCYNPLNPGCYSGGS